MINKKLAKQKTIVAWKEECADMDRWDKSFEFDEKYSDDFRGCETKSFSCKMHDRDVYCVLTFTDGREYTLYITPFAPYWDELIKK